MRDRKAASDVVALGMGYTARRMHGVEVLGVMELVVAAAAAAVVE